MPSSKVFRWSNGAELKVIGNRWGLRRLEFLFEVVTKIALSILGSEVHSLFGF